MNPEDNTLHAELEERLRFETLIADLSSKFINLPAGEVDRDTAMGLSADRARASLRFSLGKQTTADDVDLLLSVLPETVGRLRELSPIYNRAVSS